jgi:hypothetical protein
VVGRGFLGYVCESGIGVGREWLCVGVGTRETGGEASKSEVPGKTKGKGELACGF